MIPGRLLRRRRARRLRASSSRPSSAPRRSPRRCATCCRTRDGLMLRHLQRFPGAREAGPGALRRHPSHGRRLRHPHLQQHRPSPEHARATRAWPATMSPWLSRMRSGRHAHGGHQPRRGALRGAAAAAGFHDCERTGRHSVRGRRGAAFHGFGGEPQRVGAAPSRASRAPTAACSARWVTRNAPATGLYKNTFGNTLPAPLRRRCRLLPHEVVTATASLRAPTARRWFRGRGAALRR